MRTQLPMFVKAWFALDLFLALFPPLHWTASGFDAIFGVPRALLYLFGTSLVIALSVVVAYFSDSSLHRNRTGDR